jgi:Mg-chelatase subunit ChlD
VTLAPRSPSAKRLAALVERGLASSDWREVSRAVALSRPLDPELVIPYLIEALSQWKARQESGAQALRIEMEILRALENRSGRKLGLSPSDWSAWWKAVRDGGPKGQGPATGRYREGTRAAFFGIHPATDRVTFVIDRSGSMATPLAPRTGVAGSGARPSSGGRSRWEEAVEELMGFVDAIGPRARFSVILFHDYAEEWRPTLLDASPENKKSARAWLAGNKPTGGTELKNAIARAMRLSPDGQPDMAVLEADTVIVLCDGATAEGPGWVEPFLRDANLRARIVFHCVQIGAGGDGTLEKLAAGSGGEFIRVDG